MNKEQAQLAIEWLQKYVNGEKIITNGTREEVDCVVEFVNYAVHDCLMVDRSLAEIADEMDKCVNIIDGYGHFRQGQDGWQAMMNLGEIARELRVMRQAK